MGTARTVTRRRAALAGAVALIGSLVAAPATTAPAGATTYVPSTDTHCADGRPACLRATLQDLDRVLVQAGQRCSHNAVFAMSYLRMTQTYGWSRNQRGYYQDVPFANHQDAVFAKYFTDAFAAWQAGRRSEVPRAWLLAFDAARDKRVTGGGDLLLGMNAHINRDLPFVIASVGLVAPDGSSRKPDFDKVEEWLRDATGPMLAEAAARWDPALDDVSEPTGLMQATLFELVTAGRQNAWRNAQLLVAAPTPAARALVAAKIELEAETYARTLLATTAYLAPLTTTQSRERYCALNHDAAAPVPYAFGRPRPYGI